MTHGKAPLLLQDLTKSPVPPYWNTYMTFGDVTCEIFPLKIPYTSYRVTFSLPLTVSSKIRQLVVRLQSIILITTRTHDDP